MFSMMAGAMSLPDTTWLSKFLLYGVPGCIDRPRPNRIRQTEDNKITRIIQSGGGQNIIDTVLKIARRRIFKFYPIAYTLAVCARCQYEEVSRRAYRALLEVCKTPAHLFLFILYCKAAQGVKSWPRKHRNAIAKWYTSNTRYLEDIMLLAKHVTKYKRRHGFSHRRIIKCCHPKPPNDDYKFIFKYVTSGLKKAREIQRQETGPQMLPLNDVREFITDFETMKGRHIPEECVIEIIRKWDITWEHVPTVYLRSPEVWKALVMKGTCMPFVALVRNLGRMARLGILRDEVEDRVRERLEDGTIMESVNIHPFYLLSAMAGYREGKTIRRHEELTWNVNRNIVNTLVSAYLHACSVTKETNKTILLAIDVATDAEKKLRNSCLTCLQAAAAMTMAIGKNANNATAITFGSEYHEFPFQGSENSLFDFESALELIRSQLTTQVTNFELPFQCASNTFKPECIIIMTTSITDENARQIGDSFRQYRERCRKNEKCVVVCFDPTDTYETLEDPNLLEVMGVDACAVKDIIEFIDGYQDELSEVLKNVQLRD